MRLAPGKELVDPIQVGSLVELHPGDREGFGIGIGMVVKIKDERDLPWGPARWCHVLWPGGAVFEYLQYRLRCV